jgi:hypothetical protein
MLGINMLVLKTNHVIFMSETPMSSCLYCVGVYGWYIPNMLEKDTRFRLCIVISIMAGVGMPSLKPM